MYKLVFLLLAAMCFAKPTLAQDEFLSAFHQKWENSRSYLLKIAKKMPAKSYSFKPTDRQMTFRRQLLHTRENMLKLSYRYIPEHQSFQDTVDSPQGIPKPQVIHLLKEAFNAVNNTVKRLQKKDLTTKVDFFEGTKTKLQILNLIQDHVTHHRGQLIVYLNLKGYKPPDYVGW